MINIPTQTTNKDEINAGVRAYLSAYCEDDRQLNYAVLLAGPWGAGKTFFLKNFLEAREEPHLYVSLYGVRTVSDIEDQFFRQMHPVLSSKAARLGGVLLKGLAKGAFKIDWNNDASEDASIEVGVPDVKLKEFASNPKGRLLVFDDLERCSMPIPDVLGYINAFVEHENIKAIIVANEDEIDRNSKKYKRIKEKLIGQTLVVLPSASSIMPALRDLISDSWTQEFLQKHESSALEVFTLSGTHNLRALKQALWDFEKFANALRATDKSHEDALLTILKTLLALSIEARTGRISESDVRVSSRAEWATYLTKEDRPKTANEAMRERYTGINLNQPYLDNGIIADLLFKGWVAPEAILQSLDRKAPFISPDREEAWRRAWYGYQVSDDAYEAAIAEMRVDFDGRKLTEPYAFFHVFGILIQAAKIKAVKETPAEIVKLCKRYIDDLEKSDRLLVPSVSREHRIGTDYSGLGYTAVSSAEFRTLREYYYATITRLKSKNLPVEANALVEKMKSDPDAFMMDIQLTNIGPSTYWQTPILHRVSPAIFADALISLNPTTQYLIFGALKQRYTMAPEQTGLGIELKWLRKVRAELAARRRSMRPMSKSRLGDRIKEDLDPLLPKRGSKRVVAA